MGAGITLNTVVLEQLRGLRERGYDVHVSCHFDGWESRIRSEGFPVHQIELPYRGSMAQGLRASPGLLALIVRLRPALVHTHNAQHGVVGRLLARLAGVPAVHTWRYSPLDAASSSAMRLAFGVIETVASRAGQMVLFQNGEDLNMAVSHGIVPADRAELIGNGIRLERYREPAVDRRTARHRLGVPDDAEVVTCVARLQERKRQVDLLEASVRVAAVRPRLRVVLVGTGPDEQQLRRRADALGLNRVVVFAGHRNDIPDVLHASDVVCLVSRREGAPRSLLVAMAARRPVVATDVVGTRAVVQDGRTGLLVPLANPDALARALIRVLSSESLATELADRGFASVHVGGWHEEDVIDRVSGVYRRLLERAGNGSPRAPVT